MLNQEHYHHHFNEDDLINFMFLKTYDNVTIKSKLNGFYYNIQIEGFNDLYEDYWFEWVEHVPNPNKLDKTEAQEYEQYLQTVNRSKPVLETKYEDDSHIMEGLK